MNYRTRYLNTLRGDPVDRMPFVEAAQFNMVRAFSDWSDYLGENEDPRALFGFDNVGVPTGYERVPIDWYAVPRFEEKELPSPDGYRRTSDGRYGRVVKAIPASPGHPFRVRVFEDHIVRTRADWLDMRKRFRVSAEGRFPDHWDDWCEHSRTADHPIVLEIVDAAAITANLLGQQGEAGLYASFYDRPEFIREMVDHLTQMKRVCVEKALSEARVDLVSIGSDLVPLVGRNAIRDFFLEPEAEILSLVRSSGIDLAYVRGRNEMRPLLDMYQEIGVNGLNYIAEAGDEEYLDELVAEYGNSLFLTGCIDGRVLLKSFEEIEQEVEKKVRLAKNHRMVPCLHATHILPKVPWKNYEHYAKCLRERIMG